jgi:hypothetical protein
VGLNLAPGAKQKTSGALTASVESPDIAVPGVSIKCCSIPLLGDIDLVKIGVFLQGKGELELKAERTDECLREHEGMDRIAIRYVLGECQRHISTPHPRLSQRFSRWDDRDFWNRLNLAQQFDTDSELDGCGSNWACEPTQSYQRVIQLCRLRAKTAGNGIYVLAMRVQCELIQRFQ